MSTLAVTVGRVVRQHRVANGMSQQEVALLAGVGRRFVSELERGKPSVRLDKAELVLRVFGKALAVVDRR